MTPRSSSMPVHASSDSQHEQKRMTVILPAKLHRRVKSEAALRGVSLQQLVIGALHREMNDPADTGTLTGNNNHRRRNKGG